MSYNHTTVGFEAFDGFIRALQLLGVVVNVEEFEGAQTRTGRPLRKALFNHRNTPRGRSMVVEEYLAVDDPDCDGISRVAIEVYPNGQRPDLESRCETDGQIQTRSRRDPP